jgi:hypothetical protein
MNAPTSVSVTVYVSAVKWTPKLRVRGPLYTDSWILAAQSRWKRLRTIVVLQGRNFRHFVLTSAVLFANQHCRASFLGLPFNTVSKLSSISSFSTGVRDLLLSSTEPIEHCLGSILRAIGLHGNIPWTVLQRNSTAFALWKTLYKDIIYG